MNSDQKNPMNRSNQINFWYIVFAIMSVIFLRNLWVQTQTIEAITYSQFEIYLDQGAIKEVTIGSNAITGTFTIAQDGKSRFVTTPVAPDLANRLNKADVIYTGAVENTWLTTLLSWILPALIFFGIWMFFLVQSLYFIVMTDLVSEEDHMNTDTFEEARMRAEGILSK